MLIYLAVSSIGITWGLPSRSIDNYLFAGEPWSGEKIYQLAKAQEKLSPERLRKTGADVDVDPIAVTPLGLTDSTSSAPIPLTATDEEIARIYLRYRLYTYQPDEMITMMALAGMRPRDLRFDPRLYQYGGLFIYPVGGLIKLCGALGLLEVRNDLVYYLDHPDEFAKFYIVARGYAAAWGLLGIVLVYAVTLHLTTNRQSAELVPPDSPLRRGHRQHLGDHRAALLAALIFSLMPVVVCMAHEGKPHLPGAVLMLAAVYFAIRSVDQRPLPSMTGASTRQLAIGNWKFLWMCVCCGAAVGMVLSSWPICVLIPLVAWVRRPPNTRAVLSRGASGLLLAVVVYLVTNPYVLINVFINRDVLRSNFGNSLAMYEIAQVGEGLLRVVQLTAEGATIPVMLLGVAAGLLALALRSWRFLPAFWALAVPAAVFFAQFVLIGAGKPAEYGRFGIFPNTALAIGACCLVGSWRPRPSRLAAVVLVGWTALAGGAYLRNFSVDTTEGASRLRARRLDRAGFVDANLDVWSSGAPKVAVLREPAPYSCPPLPFDRCDVTLFRDLPEALDCVRDPFSFCVLLQTVDEVPLRTFLNTGHAANVATFRDRVKAFGRMLIETPISWANKPIVISVGDQDIVP